MYGLSQTNACAPRGLGSLRRRHKLRTYLDHI